jgi:hypothetical protein
MKQRQSRHKFTLLKRSEDGDAGGEEVSDVAPSYRLIFAFLALAGAVLGLILYFAPNNRWRLEPIETTFVHLDEVYKEHGLQKFLEQKSILKQSVQTILKEGSDQAQKDLASNIAVFLFPDVLPEEDFEKPLAEELWAETISEIEKHPGTAESRILFEDMRANIWNYEMVDKEDPKLSAPARQVIQIYDTMSAP